MTLPLLDSKNLIPPLRQQLVSRPRLVAKLAEGKPLTLITAPAGYGKTTLLLEWIQTLKGGEAKVSSPSLPAHPLPRVGWLSLDGSDNDLLRFLAYLVEALKCVLAQAQVRACHSALAAMAAAQSTDIEGFEIILLNSLNQAPDPFTLIVDDYHAISEPSIHHVMQYLLTHQPPAMRLVITTRFDPPFALAQLRARGRLCEIRLSDLAFTTGETAEFLNRRMGLGLSDEDIASLETRTEGWAAGLHLAALSLKGREEKHRYIQSFSGNHLFVLEYLLEEVFNRQPAAVQDFLLRTAVLDRMCASLCQAVLEAGLASPAAASSISPAHSQQILDDLERGGLFIVALDDRREWFRYHQLFADLLLNRLRLSLDGKSVAQLFHRASGWYESSGLLVEAINQSLAAPELEDAANLLEKHVLTFFYQSEITQVMRWLSALPETLLEKRPLLCAVYAASLSLMPPYPPGSLPGAEKWMQAAERSLSDPSPGSDQARAFAWIIRSYWARFRDEPPDIVLALIEKAFSFLPASLDRIQMCMRSALQANLGLTYWAAGNEAAAQQALIQARDIGIACDDQFNASASMNYLAKIRCLHGQLNEAAALCREALAFFDSRQAYLGHRAPYSAEIAIQLAEILIEQNELLEAEQILKENIELAQWTMGHNILVSGRLALARLAAAHGNLSAAFGCLDQSENISKWGTMWAAAERANLWMALSEGKPETLDLARQWAQGLSLVEFEAGPPQIEWSISLIFARWILTEAEGLPASKAKEAAALQMNLLEWLERQVGMVQARDWAHWEIRLRVIQALARQSSGDRPGALEALRRALELSRLGGYVRVFLEYGAPMRRLLSELETDAGWVSYHRSRLLEIFSAPARSTQVDALTARELEVLHLICQGLSNQQIAARLVVTLNTVKKHNYSIFQKLGVTNRAQAILAARAVVFDS